VREGADPVIRNRKGNNPLHMAIQQVIKKYSRSREKDLVSVLLPVASSSLLSVRNKKGFTCRELLVTLEKERDRVEKLEPMPSNKRRLHKVEQDEIGKGKTEEQEWRERLAWEAGQEWAEMGRYEEEEQENAEEEAETHSQWADRIYRAFSAKRRPKPPPPGPSAPKSLKPTIDLAQAEENYKKLKEKRMKERQKKLVDKLFNSDCLIGEEDLPFKGIDDTTMVEIMLEVGGEEDDQGLVKKIIREELRRWHPDKWEQKLGDRVKKGQKERVMERVKQISQALNNYGK